MISDRKSVRNRDCLGMGHNWTVEIQTSSDFKHSLRIIFLSELKNSLFLPISLISTVKGLKTWNKFKLFRKKNRYKHFCLNTSGKSYGRHSQICEKKRLSRNMGSLFYTYLNLSKFSQRWVTSMVICLVIWRPKGQRFKS